MSSTRAAWRKTTQHLLPARHRALPAGQYDIYPAHDLGAGNIQSGYDSLAALIAKEKSVIMDGYPGVMWDDLRETLDAALRARGIRAAWSRAEDALKTSDAIQALIAPFLGGDDPIFGSRFTGALRDFYAHTPTHANTPAADVHILYGCGAALSEATNDTSCLVIYADLPKNEIQFRARAGVACHIGATGTDDPKPAYKRCYFVDWVAANRHKAELLNSIDILLDTQRPDEPAWMTGDLFRAALKDQARSVFRVRPWFEPGPWGGQWIKARMPQLAQDAPNYAWSFELIVPENGILFTSDDVLLEASFDWLMFAERDAVLGDFAPRFGDEFPIRFDFLDTFDGGNLSVQCHPRPEYIRKHFGERITQDETYYILDSGPAAQVYLGFREDIDPAAFRAALEGSFATAQPIDVTRFVNIEPTRKHDLFLIPNGTIHCSGKDCLVLEISATPYIFTFKMYDWMRLDLDGRPRPLNIARAFENLYFERAGARATEELVSKQTVIASGADWQLVHCPTHAHHFYDVHRIEFSGTVTVRTDCSPHVLSLVEGNSVRVRCANGVERRYSYAETFVVPAAAGGYQLISDDGAPLKVIKAFIKPQDQWVEGSVP